MDLEGEDGEPARLRLADSLRRASTPQPIDERPDEDHEEPDCQRCRNRDDDGESDQRDLRKQGKLRPSDVRE